MVYCLWSGEEGGLRGSDYWTDTLEDNHPEVTIINYINLDISFPSTTGCNNNTTGGTII